MTAKLIQNTSVSKIAEKYRQEGYRVFVEPEPEDIPFNLGTYRPNLIAKKNEAEGYIIEFNASGRQKSIERLRGIAEIVSEHTGWRFLLVTEEDALLKDNAKEVNLLSWEQIFSRRTQSERLISLGENEGAFLSLWGIFEALLRRRAEEAIIPIERFPTVSLIKHMYSQGELSIEEYDRAMLLLSVRNRFIHGFEALEVNESVSELLALVNELISLWLPQASQS
jgi:REase_AHJR-like